MTFMEGNDTPVPREDNRNEELPGSPAPDPEDDRGGPEDDPEAD
jgi:hypothetical protein